MAYRVYLEGAEIRVEFSGVVTTRDFEDFAPVVEELERRPAVVPHRIGDLSKTSGMEIGFREVLALADRRKSRRFPNAFKSAIVAPQPVQLGLARMFQILNDHPQITIKIFPDVPSAQKWIA